MDQAQDNAGEILPKGELNTQGNACTSPSALVSSSPLEEQAKNDESYLTEEESDLYEPVPEAVDSSSVKSYEYDDDDSSVDEDEVEDFFDNEGVPMPRLSSSTVPIVVEVTNNNNGAYTSNDPLFNCVCLYNSSVKTTERQVESNNTKAQSVVQSVSEDFPLKRLWFFPSAFKHLFLMQQQRAD